MKYLIPFVILGLCGCASPKITIKETANGIIFESDEGNYSAKYKTERVEAEVDTRSNPIVNITTPDIEVGK